jgi:hypothetical protein
MKNIPSFNEYMNEAATDSSQFDEMIKALPYLEQLIQREVGFKPKLTAKVTKGRSGDYLEITSEDLVSQLGKIGAAMFNTLHLKLVGGDEVMKDDSVGFSINMEWSHPSGGTNGTGFIWNSMYYSFDESGWIAGRKIA